jgi:hypothetical protein
MQSTCVPPTERVAPPMPIKPNGERPGARDIRRGSACLKKRGVSGIVRPSDATTRVSVTGMQLKRRAFNRPAPSKKNLALRKEYHIDRISIIALRSAPP